ncbi:hypothetical protein HPB58_06775 [Priestia filamentosa]|uniref:hypothetical protein n=1 Tax=Priestia filamentosa TaxID=1402861 RepID=UPI001FB34B07|nr:hypothetical protein [Priestia filamentosa]UOE61871.1 hypothetical protein HPB58_06775 [Priestia filamentosa]
MNKLGIASISVALFNIILFLLLRGPGANIGLVVGMFGALSVLGLVFAVLSQKWPSVVSGAVLNGGGLILALVLFLAEGAIS